MDSLEALRSAYAHRIAALAGTDDPRLVAAFAAVPREDYVGPGPWQLPLAGGDYLDERAADPRRLYDDVLVGLAPERGLNNGQPSLHAACIAAAQLREGEAVVHVGAGTGYYTAILATLVGPRGRVVAYEIEPDLAARAARNLAQLPQVELRAASATEGPLPASDLVYASAGVSHPPEAWLDALAPGGRLVFPWTNDEGLGLMMRVVRSAHAGAVGLAATALARVAFVPCIGARSPAAALAFGMALARRDAQDIRSLRRGTQPDGTAWCIGDGWWLSTAAP